MSIKHLLKNVLICVATWWSNIEYIQLTLFFLFEELFHGYGKTAFFFLNIYNLL